MKGTWTGYYRYNSKLTRKNTGFEKTGFTIHIETFDGTGFEGIVNDDVSTGGMKETGKIIGYVKNDTVHFRKLMPRSRMINPDGTRSEFDKKHKVLYYTGVLSKDKTAISGKWKFKNTIGFLFGFIPIPYSPGCGTWSMTLG